MKDTGCTECCSR